MTTPFSKSRAAWFISERISRLAHRKNEKTWIETIRVISGGGRDPKITPAGVQLLTDMLDIG
jgi:hypothetical protein